VGSISSKDTRCYPWTSQFRHFGYITTSKLESAYHQLKTCLPHNQDHLLDVVQKLKNYWDNCYLEYERKLAGQYITIWAEINAQIISEWGNDLNRWIIPYALRLCREQLNKAPANEMAPNCSGQFTMIWGIPCCHDMRIWARIGRLVTADDFDHHWYWERPGAENVFRRVNAEAQRPIPTIFDPQIVAARGRPRRDRSTQRDPSQFEFSDPARGSRTPSSAPSRDPSQTLPLGSRSRSTTGSQTPSIIIS
jgi:hypothetical protein